MKGPQVTAVTGFMVSVDMPCPHFIEPVGRKKRDTASTFGRFNPMQRSAKQHSLVSPLRPLATRTIWFRCLHLDHPWRVKPVDGESFREQPSKPTSRSW